MDATHLLFTEDISRSHRKICLYDYTQTASGNYDTLMEVNGIAE
jgi:hypothetical protein